MTAKFDHPKFKNFDVTWIYENIIVVKPKMTSGDPYAKLAKIIDAPWKDELGAELMVFDTMTVAAETFLDMSAVIGNYTNSPIEFGGGKHHVVIPAEGDYRAAQSMTQKCTDLMLDLPMHIITLGHVGVEAKGKKGSKGYDILRAGMKTTGQAQVAGYGGQYDQYLYLHYAKRQDTTRVMAQCQGGAVFASKVRKDGELPPENIFVPNTLELQRKWWHDFAKIAGIDFDNPQLTGYFNMAMYGELGTGKTRLALSMPRGPIVYVAVDRGSEYLRSMYKGLKTLRVEA